MLLNISDWSRPVTIKWLASLALPGLLYVLLTTYGDPATLNPNMIMFLCITLWAVCAWAMNTLNDVAVGLLLPMLYVAFCGVKQGVVFRPCWEMWPSSPSVALSSARSWGPRA